MTTVAAPDRSEVIRCLALRLAHAIEAGGLVQRQVAERGGLEQGQVSRLARGRTDCKAWTLHQVAFGAGTTAGWLATPEVPDALTSPPPRQVGAPPHRDDVQAEFSGRFRLARQRVGLVSARLPRGRGRIGGS